VSALEVTWGAVVEPLPGQARCGDAHLVAIHPGGALIAGIDGLGHGTDAADASTLARATLLERPELAVNELFRRCHRALRDTRGAAVTLASLTGNTLVWAGIGNVEGWFLRANPGGARPRESVPLRGGVVGYSLPPRIATSSLTVADGDVLLLASDGMSLSTEDLKSLFGVLPAVGARMLHDRFWTRKDDGMLLVARFASASSQEPTS
jgi:hypothetical protein